MKLEISPIKTRVVKPPKDDISDIIDSLEVEDGDIIFITSKILAIHQRRTRKTGKIKKIDLVCEEAERMLSYKNEEGNFNVNLTVAHGVLIPAAGIDESNANGYYILWPKKIDEACREIRARLMKKFDIKRLGVVVTDSHTMPLRWGVTGLTIGLSGVEPLKDIRGETDIFNRKMKLTKVDMIDPLAAIVVREMGESSECTPIAIVRGDTSLVFSDTASMDKFKISPETDLYRPLIETLPKL